MFINLIASALAEKLYYILTGHALREYRRRNVYFTTVTDVLKSKYSLTSAAVFYCNYTACSSEISTQKTTKHTGTIKKTEQKTPGKTDSFIRITSEPYVYGIINSNT